MDSRCISYRPEKQECLTTDGELEHCENVDPDETVIKHYQELSRSVY